MTSFVAGTSSVISYVYAIRRPRKCATNETLDPIRIGGGVCHWTDLIFTYHRGAFVGSPAYAATSSRALLMTISDTTSTANHGREGDSMLEVGDTAPDFSVKDHEGKVRSLKDYRGKTVVLWFYPKADTPG